MKAFFTFAILSAFITYGALYCMEEQDLADKKRIENKLVTLMQTAPENVIVKEFPELCAEEKLKIQATLIDFVAAIQKKDTLALQLSKLIPLLPYIAQSTSVIANTITVKRGEQEVPYSNELKETLLQGLLSGVTAITQREGEVTIDIAKLKALPGCREKK